MNNLQRYLDLRGLTAQAIALAIGIGYHTVQKTIKGHRRCPRIRIAIATYLGLDAEKLWGRGSVLYIRKAVAEEASRQAETKRREIINHYAPSAPSVKPLRHAVNV